jgi:hypothetical protein
MGTHKSDLVCSAAYLHGCPCFLLFFTFQIEDPFFLFMGSGPIVTIELNVSAALKTGFLTNKGLRSTGLQ